MIQASLFDFKPKVIERTVRHHVLTDQYEEDKLLHLYRSDARCMVDSFGTYYDGTALTDTRILDNHYDHKGGFNSQNRDDEWPFESFLQLGGHFFKIIGADGTVVDYLRISEYDPIQHTYTSRREVIKGISMDDSKFYVTIDSGDVYEGLLDDDEGCDPYRVTKYDPTTLTEHFINEAMRRGVLPRELSIIRNHYAYYLEGYVPFTLDRETGTMKPYDIFILIGEIGDRVGLYPKFSYDVPKPTPEKWDVYPSVMKKYCQHRKRCPDVKDGNHCCIGCDKYLYNRQPIRPEDLDDPTKPKKSRKKGKKDICEDEDCCCEEDCE